MCKGEQAVLEKMVNLSSDIFINTDEHGLIIYSNDACQNTLGYKCTELSGRHISELLHAEEVERTKVAIRDLLENGHKDTFRNRCIHKSGHEVLMQWTGLWSVSDNVMCFVGRDVTAQTHHNKLLFAKEERHRALCEHGSDMLALFNEDLQFTYSGGSTTRILGYSQEQLIGVNALTLIHPDDIHKVEEKLAQVLISEGHTTISDFRFRHSNGEWRWLETCLSNQLNNPAVCALVTSTRDVTEKYLDRQQLMEIEQQLRSMFVENPDTVLMEDLEGVILDANKAAEEMMGEPRAALIGRHITEFLPPDAVAVCMQHLNEACQGKTIRFELKAFFEGRGELILDITKIPMSANGRVRGVYTVVKDITAKTKLYRATEEHALKLTAIFESITDAFCTIDRNWNYTYLNNEFERLTGFKKEDVLAKSFFELYPDEGNTAFYRNYKRAMETGNPAHFDSYSPEHDKWFEVKVFPSEEGLSVYFSDITDKIKAQKEVERLSLVASSTTNGVLLMKPDRRIEWLNEGFTKLTGYCLEEVAGKRPIEFLAHEQTEPAALTLASERNAQGEPTAFEVLNKTKDGKDLWLSVKENPILGEDGRIAGLVSIQTDITDLKKYQQELETLSLVASRTNNGVIIADRDWGIEWVNEGFSRLTGYALPEATGKTPSKLLHKHNKGNEAFKVLEEKLLKGESISFEELIYKKSGEETWVNVDITAIFDKGGAPSRFIEVHTEITLLKEKELDLSRLASDLYRQNNDLQQFTYIVSHNLRAPVANALGLTNLLSKIDRNTDMFDQMLANLKESIVRLDTVMKDMNTILSIRDNKGNFETEQVSVKLVINQVVSSLQASLSDCGGYITDDLPEGLSVSANKAYLYSIFYNLLSNAMKYRSNDRALAVSIKCISNTEQGTLISFADNGSGFDLQKAKGHVFKLYKRFHTDKKGRGIGLYLVREHLDAIGGHVEVVSQVGAGTKFLIYLPKI